MCTKSFLTPPSEGFLQLGAGPYRSIYAPCFRINSNRHPGSYPGWRGIEGRNSFVREIAGQQNSGLSDPTVYPSNRNFQIWNKHATLVSTDPSAG